MVQDRSEAEERERDMILEGRTAIVTGAGSGIGRAAAEIIARERATVAVVDRNADGANETVEQIRAAGGKARALIFDVTDDRALEENFIDFIKAEGRIDILHNHAGAQVEGDLLAVSVAGFDKSWSLNVRAHFLGARI